MKKVYAHYRIDNMGALNPAGGVTMYAEWDTKTGVLLAMGAVCTLEDNYNYKRGRAIAEGRFKKYHNVGGNGINVPQAYPLTKTSEQVHACLANVARDLAVYIKSKEGGLSLRRYYRSVGEFEEIV